MTPLHLAARGGHTAVARVLLQAGDGWCTTVGARDGEGRTSAAWARQQGHVELAEELETVVVNEEKESMHTRITLP